MNEQATIAREYLQSALDVPIAYLHITHHSNPEADPLEVAFSWDEEGFGTLSKVNLRDEYLEVFRDDPEHYAKQMPGVVAALRKLADEIEEIYSSATPNDRVEGRDAASSRRVPSHDGLEGKGA